MLVYIRKVLWYFHCFAFILGSAILITLTILIFSNVNLHIPCEHKVPYLWDVLEHHRKLKNFDPRALEIQKISTKQSQLNNTYREKLMFHQFSTKMAVLMSVLATSDLFHIFTPLIKFYRFNYQLLNGTDVLKIWFIK